METTETLETAESPKTPENLIIPICSHIKASGLRCGSPAVKGSDRCFYHENLEISLPVDRNLYVGFKLDAKPGEWPLMNFPVPPLEDAAAIQTTFMMILHGIAVGTLNAKRAKLMLSALHGASANLNRLEQCLAQCQAKTGENKIGKKPPATEESATLSAKRNE